MTLKDTFPRAKPSPFLSTVLVTLVGFDLGGHVRQEMIKELI